jgi:hypothetical protein
MVPLVLLAGCASMRTIEVASARLELGRIAVAEARMVSIAHPRTGAIMRIVELDAPYSLDTRSTARRLCRMLLSGEKK